MIVWYGMADGATPTGLAGDGADWPAEARVGEGMGEGAGAGSAGRSFPCTTCAKTEEANIVTATNVPRRSVFVPAFKLLDLIPPSLVELGEPSR